MRVLLIEDDDAKRELLVKHIKNKYENLEIVEAISFRGALAIVKDFEPTIVLLDMTIPSFESGVGEGHHPLVYGGRDVLRQMRRLGVHSYVVVVTQYERFGDGPESISLNDLSAQLRDIYPECFRGAVFFSFVYDTWKEEIDRHIEYALSE